MSIDATTPAEPKASASATRRIALFSDVHGNLEGLDRVLADIAASGIHERFCLGDLVGYGPDPAGVIARIRELDIPTIRGNYDDGVGAHRGDCGCSFATEAERACGILSYETTVRALSTTERAWLAELPLELRLEHRGLRILLTHGSPRRINEYLTPDLRPELLLQLAEDARADVVCVGHVHIPYHRRIERAGGGGPVHFICVGSVGKPKDGDPRSAWVELLLGDDGSVDTAVHRV
ncbi:MAG: metallophosphatase family protein [Actinobacteria bacterium]|nr:metallophosphatase family protein [Actinomycetota bacterium]